MRAQTSGSACRQAVSLRQGCAPRQVDHGLAEDEQIDHEVVAGEVLGGDRAQMACAEVDLTYHPKQVKALDDEVGPCTR